MENNIKRATGLLVIEVVNSNRMAILTVRVIHVNARTALARFPRFRSSVNSATLSRIGKGRSSNPFVKS